MPTSRARSSTTGRCGRMAPGTIRPTRAATRGASPWSFIATPGPCGSDRSWSRARPTGWSSTTTYREPTGPSWKWSTATPSPRGREPPAARLGADLVLAFWNHTNLGVYREALERAAAAPDVTATRAPGRSKYGFGLNLEQELGPGLGVFLRAGWNDGKTESWA